MKALSFLWRAASQLLFFALLAGFAYYTYTKLRPDVPCAQPITYTIGEFDNRFGISREDFLSQVDAATKIWEKPIGADLFKYDPNGELKINLIYDSRQQTTQKNQQLQSTVQGGKTDAASVQVQYLALKAQYEQERSAYETAAAAFNADQKKYEAEVQYYNSKGGAPKSEYDLLNAEKQSLVVRQQQLESQRQNLNTEVVQINDMIDKYNLLVAHVNDVVTDINSTSGKEFSEGLYVRDSAGVHIDIYEYSTKVKLLRVLAHELGHALGLDHNENPKSIMYALNQSTTEVLSADDLAALKARCKVK